MQPGSGSILQKRRVGKVNRELRNSVLTKLLLAVNITTLHLA